MRANVVGLLREIGAAFPDKPALLQGRRVVRYREMLNDIERIALYFHEKGIERGDGVLVFVPMSIDLYKIVVALFHLGAVAVFVDAWADRERLSRARSILPLKAFIGAPKARLIRLLSREIASIPTALFTPTEKWRPRTVPIPEPADVGPDDPALVTFTTGSTGGPKGANRTHGFLAAQHHALVRHFEPQPEDVDMATLPIFPLSNLAAGATTVLPPIDPRRPGKFTPAHVAAAIERHGVTSIAGSPAFFHRLAEIGSEQYGRLSSVRRVFVGGAPVLPGTLRLLTECFPGAQTTVVYGSTEAEPISMLPVVKGSTAHHDTPGLFVGFPVSSIDILIARRNSDREEQGVSEAEVGEVGEILVAGEHVLSSYLGEQGMIDARAFYGKGRKWLGTGDAGFLDAVGGLHLMGRMRRSFVVGGARVFPLPAEVALADLPGLEIGTVLNVGEKVTAVLEVKRGTAASSIAAMRKEALERLRDIGIPAEDAVVLRRIPRDPRHASKIDYEKLASTVGRRPGR